MNLTIEARDLCNPKLAIFDLKFVHWMKLKFDMTIGFFTEEKILLLMDTF